MKYDCIFCVPFFTERTFSCFHPTLVGDCISTQSPAAKEVYMDENKKINDNQTENTQNEQIKRSNAHRSAAYISKIAMLSALGCVLLLIEFPIFPATPWLKLNFSDLPTLLASFMFGPISGTIVNAVKIGVTLLARGTSSAFVGDLSNLISGTLYALTAGIIYKLKKDKSGAIIALISGSLLFCISMIACNAFLLLPAYGIKDQSAMIPLLLWTLLFNVIKTSVTSLLTFFLYKKLHMLFKKF